MESDILNFFDAFHTGALELDGLNRAYLVLLPKKDSARTVDAFRPISLQNCPMKLFSKALVHRLQPLIPSLVDRDQTGFLLGRSIAENFVYAADLLSACYKRKQPTVVLKLDFRKAFDSVNWDRLDSILAIRGFDKTWRRWVRQILSTGKTAVLLNGVPGRWINCQNGLRQGDPLSPYLFIIVADVLQKMINAASLSGVLPHPLLADATCPVLQYADDTLILVKAELLAIVHLKSILDQFSSATGLDINFHKTTFVPMHVEDSLAGQMAAVLGCPISSFPQVYLGLPLSPTKLRFSDYQPLCASFDRYLSGWRARLLSPGGRIVLSNAVLSNLPVYWMSSLLFPRTVLIALDRRRLPFLWTGEDKCHGSQCLVAWDQVCLPKIEGGLGVKDLELQNHCLLMKFIDKLHQADPLPWKQWLQQTLARDLGDGAHDSFLGLIIQEELQRYRSLTKSVGIVLSPNRWCIMVGPRPSGWMTGFRPARSTSASLLSSPIPKAPISQCMSP